MNQNASRAARSVIADIIAAVDAFNMARGHEPVYLVIDAESLSGALGDICAVDPSATKYHAEILSRGPVVARGVDEAGRWLRVCGLIVVVIPTDGIPLIRVVGEAIEEAQRELAHNTRAKRPSKAR